MSGLSSSAWFTGDDGPADPPSERPVPPVAAPVSAPRTLPVTPAERCLATCLRSFQAWNTHPDAGIDEEDEALQLMLGLGEWLQEEGMLNDDEPGFTPAGAALLARVGAAERTPETVLRAMLHVYQDAAVEAEAEVFRAGGTPLAIAERRMLEAQDAAANMRATAATYAAEGFLLPWLALRTDYAARLSGTTPIDAPANAYKIGPISAGRVVTAVSTPTRIHTAAGSVVELLPGESVEIEPCPPAKEPR